MKILGIHDFPMSSAMWLDATVSLSWIRAWEALSLNHSMYACVKEPHVTHVMSSPVRGVYFEFIRNEDFWKNLLSSVKRVDPDCILYNCFEYERASKFITLYQNTAPQCLHIMRTHHEVRRVFPLPRLDSLNVADSWIVSTEQDAKWLARARVTADVADIIPFGVDVNYFADGAGGEKTLDFVASAGSNPVKQLPLLEVVFEILRERGYTARNVLGKSKKEYRDILQSARVYVTLTTSEASGSRSLLEAIVSGARPAVFEACECAVELAQKFNGIVLSGTAVEIASALEEFLKAPAEDTCAPDMTNYSECAEVSRLCAVFVDLSSLDARVHRHITHASKLREILLWFSNARGQDTGRLADYAMLEEIPSRDTITQMFFDKDLKKYMFGFLDKELTKPADCIRDLSWIACDCAKI